MRTIIYPAFARIGQLIFKFRWCASDPKEEGCAADGVEVLMRVGLTYLRKAETKMVKQAHRANF